MPNIPNGTKFHGVASFVGTTNRGSALTNSMRDAYTIEELSQFVSEYIINSSVTKIIPYFLTATAGGETDFDTDYNMVDIDWSGGSGTHVLNLPSATDVPYRVIRISNNSTVVASDKIHVTAPVGETIDGAAFYSINKPYNGIAVWSDGNQWVVIQAKSN